MSSKVRKKKPKAPSMSLVEAIEKARKIYQKEGRHTVPVESVAEALGYTNARSGSAITTIASIKMFGLLNSPQSGHLAIDQSFEEFEYSPDEQHKREILIKWLTTPKIFEEVLQRFEGTMPSDATLKYELVKMGFSGKGLDKFIDSFKESVSYAQYYEQQNLVSTQSIVEGIYSSQQDTGTNKQLKKDATVTAAIDRIPIRLSGGRRAWLELPDPFYESDKEIIKKQIEVIVPDNNQEMEE